MPTLNLDGTAVSFRDVGQGPPAILLHSSSSHSGQWRQLSDSIRDRFQVLAPDFHGYGQSDPLPQDDRPYFEHDAAIVNELLNTVDGPTHLVGHSLGGTIAARIALERPDDVASLTLIEPVLFNLLEETRDPRRVEYLEIAHSIMVLVRLGRLEQAARLFLDFWVGPGGLDGMDDGTRAYIVRTVGRVADDWVGISGLAPGALVAADFQRLSPPTLLLCGEETRDSTRAIVEILLEAIPQVDYREVPGAGHMSPVTHPALVNSMIVEFIDR